MLAKRSKNQRNAKSTGLTRRTKLDRPPNPVVCFTASSLSIAIQCAYLFNNVLALVIQKEIMYLRLAAWCLDQNHKITSLSLDLS